MPQQAKATRYVVKTPTGYVGRDSFSTPLVATMPVEDLAYVYGDRAEAEAVAQSFGGEVVERGAR